MIIAIDVDDTVAKTTEEVCRLHNIDYDGNITPEDITSWEIHKHVSPECGEQVYDYFRSESLYDHVKPMKGALKAINQLREDGHEIVFVTSTPVHIAGVKCRWLWTHDFIAWDPKGYYKDYIECVDKSKIRADVIIDDRPKNCLEFDGASILFCRPHNKLYRLNEWNYKDVRLVDRWKDVNWLTKELEISGNKR